MDHITIAVSARSLSLLFNRLTRSFHFIKSDRGDFGPFSASYNVDISLQDGSLILNDDGTVQIKDMKLVWNILSVNICFEIPGFRTPEFCIVPNPWNGCLINAPSIHIGGPICPTIDLSGIVSKISNIQAIFKTNYFVNPARNPIETDLEAEFAGHHNYWQVFMFIDSDTIDIDLIDISDSVINVFENSIKKEIENMIPSWIPQWGKDIILSFIGPILDFVKNILGIAEDIKDWISNLIKGLTSNDIFSLLWKFIKSQIAYNFGKDNPIKVFEDPFPILAGSFPTGSPHPSNPIPVKIPIRNLRADINSKEIILIASIGDA